MIKRFIGRNPSVRQAPQAKKNHQLSVSVPKRLPAKIDPWLFGHEEGKEVVRFRALSPAALDVLIFIISVHVFFLKSNQYSGYDFEGRGVVAQEFFAFARWQPSGSAYGRLAKALEELEKRGLIHGMGFLCPV